MNDELKLTILKQNLQQLTSANDPYLINLLKQAEGLVEREGIKDDETNEYYMAVIDYAAFLFRKRAQESTQSMPRSLRYELNVLLMSQKAKEE